jgi:hypothetical protein
MWLKAVPNRPQRDKEKPMERRRAIKPKIAKIPFLPATKSTKITRMAKQAKQSSGDNSHQFKSSPLSVGAIF